MVTYILNEIINDSFTLENPNYSQPNIKYYIQGILQGTYNIQTDTYTPATNGDSNNYIEKGENDNEYNVHIKLTNTPLTVVEIQYGDNYQPNGDFLFKEDYKVRTINDMPFAIITEITDTETLHRLQNNKPYRAQTDLTIITEHTDEYIDRELNHRILVVNNEYCLEDTSNYTDTEIAYALTHATSISEIPSELNTATTVYAEFNYDEDYPIQIIITAENRTGNPNHFTVNYTPIRLYENTGDKLSDYQAHHITPIQNITDDDNTTNANITLNAFEYSNPFVLSQFKDLTETEEDIDNQEEDTLGTTYGNTDTEVVRGIQINIPVIESDHITLHALLKTDTGKIGQRSILIDPITSLTNVTIGDEFDLWGLQIKDMENLEDWELKLQLINNENKTVNTIIGDISLTYYTATIEDNVEKIYVEDDCLDWYNAILTDCDIPVGLNTETKQFEIEGSDINTAYLQNVRDKTIKVYFEVDSCSLTESTQLLDSIARLFYNERDENNWPIPKTFKDDRYPGKEWKYIVTDEMNVKIVTGGYECRIDLLVPSGTYNSTEQIITGAIGYNGGLCKVNPTIEITNISSEISITENRTGQKFIIRPEGFSSNDIVTIDCENRTITKTNEGSDTTEDWSGYCDLDNDWFSINKEYNFTESGCKIISVAYYEKG